MGALSEQGQSPTSPPCQRDTDVVLRAFWAKLQLCFGLEGTSKLLSFQTRLLLIFAPGPAFVLEISIEKN